MDPHDLSIISRSLANHEILADDVLTNLDWRTVLESPDPFCVFSASQLFRQIIEHDSNSNTRRSALKIWIDTAVSQVYVDNLGSYLELFHSLLKRTRKLKDGIEESNISSDPGYILLSVLATNPKTNEWIQSSLEIQHQEKIVPLLVCLIDIVKLAGLFEYKNSLVYSQQGRDYCQAIIHSIKAHLKQVYPYWRSQSIAVVRKSMELVRRILEREGDTQMVVATLNDILSYSDFLNRRGFSYDHLLTMQQTDRTEFFYEPFVRTKSVLAVDRECLKQIISITFVSISRLLDSTQTPKKEEMDTTYEALVEIFNRLQGYHERLPDNGILELLFDIYGNNDEDAIYQQICILDVYTAIELQVKHEAGSTKNIMTREQLKVVCLLKEILSLLDISPHNLFLYFLYKTGMDHGILVDLLISNETDFLSFFVRYLKYIAHQPDEFVKACINLLNDEHEEEEEDESEYEDDDPENGLEMISSIFHNLISVLTSEGFPYNPTALIHRILYVTNYIDNILNASTSTNK
ncbi:lines N-terminus-domain-containing protein [Phycomyces blakesleeanus]|uniref:Protein Lines N-terminal domain-containing protein n=2 Tax=Phycomyces blakesleeanus TaxID=4837 RepID=A0A167M7J7_PHYB8|nr:hypothetical protein PHYBLDRAFT_68696 [Phycomyces blakesleeanus NRRL 1555(-)]OAD72034.1 hypothetical protein PHYBLDRAFT_68696 [Phycomyces blakesleeanus NRRL 1555(-)]|eukprot:XP_018290074.1 hypothetical protein PHYBLDRAFT_68696 [Phycomyces blakesleeanus NRRL 1555(-)]